MLLLDFLVYLLYNNIIMGELLLLGPSPVFGGHYGACFKA